MNSPEQKTPTGTLTHIGAIPADSGETAIVQPLQNLVGAKHSENNPLEQAKNRRPNASPLQLTVID